MSIYEKLKAKPTDVLTGNIKDTGEEIHYFVGNEAIHNKIGEYQRNEKTLATMYAFACFHLLATPEGNRFYEGEEWKKVRKSMNYNHARDIATVILGLGEDSDNVVTLGGKVGEKIKN